MNSWRSIVSRIERQLLQEANPYFRPKTGILHRRQAYSKTNIRVSQERCDALVLAIRFRFVP